LRTVGELVADEVVKIAIEARWAICWAIIEGQERILLEQDVVGGVVLIRLVRSGCWCDQGQQSHHWQDAGADKHRDAVDVGSSRQQACGIASTNA
jgi:hypothetical protein